MTTIKDNRILRLLGPLQGADGTSGQWEFECRICDEHQMGVYNVMREAMINHHHRLLAVAEWELRHHQPTLKTYLDLYDALRRQFGPNHRVQP